LRRPSEPAALIRHYAFARPWLTSRPHTKSHAELRRRTVAREAIYSDCLRIRCNVLLCKVHQAEQIRRRGTRSVCRRRHTKGADRRTQSGDGDFYGSANRDWWWNTARCACQLFTICLSSSNRCTIWPHMLSFRCLICKKCARPTPLPVPKHLGTTRHQSWWPKDALPRNFLCPHCKRVFEYSAQDVRQRLLDDKALGPLRKGRSVVSVEVPCDRQGCVSRIRIHVVVPFDADLSSTIRGFLHEAIAYSLRCGNGHLKNAQCDAEFADDARFEDDWDTNLGSA
jgi:hypothetical protein